MTDNDSHISIEMQDGTSCRAFIDFAVYNTDEEGGKIIRLDYKNFVQMAVMVATHHKRQKTLTDLPHSPARTLMRSIDL